MRFGSQTQHTIPAQPPRGGHGRDVARSVEVPAADENNRCAEIEDRGFDVSMHATRLNRHGSANYPVLAFACEIAIREEDVVAHLTSDGEVPSAGQQGCRIDSEPKADGDHM